MLPQTYILIVKGSVMAVAVLLIILGFFLLQKKQKSDFEFSFSLLDKLSAQLKSAHPGLLMILLGIVLLLSILLIPMKAEWWIPIEEKKPPPPKEFPPFQQDIDAFKKKEK